MECWNNGIMGSGLRLGEGNGMVGLENQNEYNCIDFQRLVKISGCDAKYKHFKRDVRLYLHSRYPQFSRVKGFV
jgi:hypothetical protein